LAPDKTLSDAPYTLGVIAWQTGEFEDAAREMQAAIDLNPVYGEAYLMLGTILKQQGN
jgi:Flp pilus assembly protein TadD